MIEPASSGWDPAAVATAAGGARFPSPLVVLDTVDSTNEEVWRRAAGGAREGLVVVADRQTRGRGRGGSAWYSPPGVGAWASLLLEPSIPADRLPLLTFLAGVAAARAAEEVGASAGLKWPNDLLAVDGTGRKLGGILSESRARDGGGWQVVLGIGVNVNAVAGDFPEELRPRAASLRQVAGRELVREQYLGRLLARLDEGYRGLLAGDAESVLGEWRRRAAIFGRHVRVRAGAAEIAGVARDVSDEGALVVRLDSGAELEVRAGELEVVWEGSAEHA